MNLGILYYMVKCPEVLDEGETLMSMSSHYLDVEENARVLQGELVPFLAIHRIPFIKQTAKTVRRE